MNPQVGETLPKLATGMLLLWLVVAPLVFIVLAGLGLIDDQFLRPWHTFAGDQRLGKVLENTLLLAVTVTVAATVFGTLLALAVERARLAWTNLLDTLILVPIMVSPLVGAVAWVTLGRPRTGFINTLWRSLSGTSEPLFSIYSFTGVALVISLHLVPYVYLNVRSALQNVDGSMEEAAYMLGAGTLRTWGRITLPLVLPATLSSALLVFVITVETFSVVGLLGGPAGFITLPFSIYLAINLPPGDWAYAAFQGVLLVLLTGTLMLGYWRIVGAGGRYSTIGAKGFRHATKTGGGVARGLAVVVWAYVFVAVLLPLAALALQSLLGFATTRFEDMAFTLNNWSRLMGSPAFQSGLVNTLVVGGLAATIAVAISLVVSHLSVFERLRSLDTLASLPLAFPGIVLGMALVFMYSASPVYGTIWVVIIGYATQFLPFACRSLAAPMLQLDRGVDEAGKTLGATLWRRILGITAPMNLTAVLSAWILTFTRSIRELNVAIFLCTPATAVLPLLIWNYMEQGVFGLAATLSLVQVALLAPIVAFAQHLGRRMRGRGVVPAALAQGT